ncbi:MAG: cytochrome c family protein [Gammaproteobacteria bacterium]
MCVLALTSVACQSDHADARVAAAQPDQTASSDTPVRANPRLGRRSFLRCRSCHNLNDTVPALVGPNLTQLFGRQAGTQPGFGYSNALVNADIVWSKETLRAWLTDPAAYRTAQR